MIYDEILMFCLLFKSPSFSFEHEYRMGIPFEDQYLGENCSKEFLLSGTTIRPQLELKISRYEILSKKSQSVRLLPPS